MTAADVGPALRALVEGREVLGKAEILAAIDAAEAQDLPRLETQSQQMKTAARWRLDGYPPHPHVGGPLELCRRCAGGAGGLQHTESARTPQ